MMRYLLPRLVAATALLFVACGGDDDETAAPSDNNTLPTCDESRIDQIGKGDALAECDCQCDTYDSDCDNTNLRVRGCDLGQQCINQSGKPACVEPGQAPDGWTCDAALFGAYARGIGDATCECNCGVWDTDCGESTLAIVGCNTGELCIFQDGSPTCSTDWTCEQAQYNQSGRGDGNRCHCECGIWDPDCDNKNAEVNNCGEGTFTCEKDGNSSKCVEVMGGTGGTGGSAGSAGTGGSGATGGSGTGATSAGGSGTGAMSGAGGTAGSAGTGAASGAGGSGATSGAGGSAGTAGSM